MKIRNRELQEVWSAINSVSSLKVGNPDFRWGLALNKGVVRPLIDAVTETLQADSHQDLQAKLAEFNKKRREKVSNVALKAPDGSYLFREIMNPVTGRPDKEFVVDPIKESDLEAEIDVLRQEYKDALEAEKDFNKTFNDLLEKTLDVQFHLISESDVPKEELTADQLYGLMPLISNGEAPKKVKKKK